MNRVFWLLSLLLFSTSAGLKLVGIHTAGSPVGLHAQNEPYTIFSKIDADQLYVRWMPNSEQDFRHVLGGSMVLEVYQVSGSDLRPQLQLLDTKSLRPMPYEEWRRRLAPVAWDTLGITATYGLEMEADLLALSFLAPEYEDTEESAWRNRYLFSNYGLSYYWPAIERSAMGYTRTVDPNVDLYALKIYPTNSGDTLWIDVDVANYEPPGIPELEGVFKDRRVELKWRTLEYRPDFFGWELERSFNDGDDWESVFELPLINDNDTITGVGDALKFLMHEDILPDNDLPVLYRLRGADYLGGFSQNESILTGEGREDIRRSPLLLETIQTDSNHAVIRWEFPQDREHLIDEFRIIHTDSAGHNYRTALEGIDARVREVSIPMKFRSNFFRVQAVSTQGTVLSSFESLVMAYDDEPPAVPREFSGYIDSTGLAHLSWITSNEPDLKGYYLFKGYFEGRELAMITADPLSGSDHIDTVNMQTGNEWIYYQLRSVDTRGNGSNFTPVLKLKKPDLFPPSPGQFTSTENDGRSIRLQWTQSASQDAAVYEIYRRELENETDFGLVLRFDAENFVGELTDSLVTPTLTYAYTMVVIDDDGLESEPARPVSVQLTDLGIRSPIESFNAVPNTAANSILLSWAYDLQPREYYIYKGVDDEPISLLKAVSGSLTNFTDERLRIGRNYRYAIQAIFEDGDVSPFLELEIVLE
ncbi:MAG: hypothetical protein AAFP08_04375 [Bacteroidota bacterium]